MYKRPIRFFAVKSLKMTFFNFFSTFCHEKNFSTKSFAFSICVQFFFMKDNCDNIVLTDENPLLQSLFCCC